MNRPNPAAGISTTAPSGHPQGPIGYSQSPYGNPNLNPAGLSGLGVPGGSMAQNSLTGSLTGGQIHASMQPGMQPGQLPPGYYSNPGAGRGIPIGPNGMPLQSVGGGRGMIVSGPPGQGAVTVRYGPAPPGMTRIANGMGVPTTMAGMGRGGPGQSMQGMTVVSGGVGMPQVARVTRPGGAGTMHPSHPQYAQYASGQQHMLIPQPPHPNQLQPGQQGQLQQGQLQPGQLQPGQPSPQRQAAFSQMAMSQMGQMGAAQLAQQLGAPQGNAMQMAAGQMSGPGMSQGGMPMQPQMTGGSQSGMSMSSQGMGGQSMGGQSMGGQQGMGSQLPMNLGPNPMGVNPMTGLMTGGASPQRQGSPHPHPNSGSGSGSNAGTPANAPTPGKRGTPANAPTPYPARAPTPNRPPTSHSNQPLTFPSHQTPRLQNAESMQFSNPQASPRQMQRNPSMGAQPPNSLPPGSQGQINPATMRPTPSQVIEQSASEIYGPGPGPGGPQGYSIYPPGTGPPGQPMGPGGQRFVQRMSQPMGQPMGMAPMQPQHTGPGPLQPQHTGPHQVGPLQSQHTGGSIESMQGIQAQHPGGGGQPLAPQHTGGSMSQHPGSMQAHPGGPPQQPPHPGLQPQHTGGSMHGDTVMGPPPGPGRGSVPSTPRTMAARPAGMMPHPGMGGPPGSNPMGMPGPGMGGPGGMMMNPMMSMSIGGFPISGGPGLGGEMGPPPPPGMNPAMNGGMGPGMGGHMDPMHRDIQSELDDVNEMTMRNMGMMGASADAPRRHAFGILRLLHFSDHLGNLEGDPRGHDADYWSKVIRSHFTGDARFAFRAFQSKGTHQNTFVNLTYNLLIRFFTTLTQSSINRMSLILDGATEYQDGQDYVVYCGHARWPMYYDNGYVIELNGVLKAKCRTVPLNGEGGTPSMSNSLPPGHQPSPSPIKTEAPNPHSSPANNCTNNRSPMEVDTKPNGQPSTMGVPYVVKIHELSFDSQGMRRYVDLDAVNLPGRKTEQEQEQDGSRLNRMPSEPQNMYGIPSLTMRMLEFSEGSDALIPVMGWMHRNNTTPIPAMFGLVQKSQADQGRGTPPQGMIQPSQTMGLMINGPPPGYSMPPALFFPGPGGLQPGQQSRVDMQGSLPEGEDSYAQMTINPNSLTSNGSMVAPSGAAATSSAPNSTGAPSVSPTLSTKVPGKKGTLPPSPTKGNEKEKGGKRKNTVESGDGPPSKRTRVTTRKGSTKHSS